MSQEKWKVTLNRTVYLSKDVFVYASDVIGAKSEALVEARLMNDDEWDVEGSEVEVEEAGVA